MSDSDIVKLRGEIDGIDDQIMALLDQRSAVVKKVGMTKAKRQADGQAFIRSGREASMLRRIYERCKQGAFPAHAATQLWRTIICASLSLESQLTVTACAPENNEIYWLAREYFGGVTPVNTQPTAKRTLGDIIDAKAEVGVLPLPGGANDGAWWVRLPKGLKIFACVPFVLAKGAEVKAVAVARVEPEDTGDDVTFLSLETDMDTSQSRLKSVFDKQKLSVRWLATENLPNCRAHLVEVKGFVNLTDESIIAFKNELGSSLLALEGVGAYATPIVL